MPSDWELLVTLIRSINASKKCTVVYSAISVDQTKDNVVQITMADNELGLGNLEIRETGKRESGNRKVENWVIVELEIG
jgi:hypothetical protein